MAAAIKGEDSALLGFDGRRGNGGALGELALPFELTLSNGQSFGLDGKGTLQRVLGQ